jgi:pyruvate dehydrogenase E2 component (dihydrolipoamide acetyltransferase)
MAIEFKLPNLGENIDSGDVIGVLVNEGDTITAEQSVFEIETGKATIELPCPHAGRVTKILVKQGDKVSVGTPLLTIEAAEAKAEEKPADAPAKPAAEPEDAVDESPEDDEPAEPEAPPPRRAAKAEKRPAEPPDRPQPASRARPAADREGVARDRATGANGSGDRGARQNGTQADDHEPAPAAPATRRLARELGIDLHQVTGSGPGGRITREDVMAAVREANSPSPSTAVASSSAPTSRPRTGQPAVIGGVEDDDAWGAVRRVPLTKIRKVIAANMARSHTTIPHVTNFDDADITELERMRKASAADYEGTNVKLTTMVFILKAVAHALKQHPAINASLDLDNDEVIYKEYVNVGVAVDTERGLVVPVIRDTDALTVPLVARELTRVAELARSGKLSLDDMRGGTFTVSNLGAVGGTYSTPIINAPEVAILLVGRSRQLPVVVKDKIEPRLMCPLSLSYDHRWVDGAVAARFLNEVKGYLEAPARLLLAP